MLGLSSEVIWKIMDLVNTKFKIPHSTEDIREGITGVLTALYTQAKEIEDKLEAQRVMGEQLMSQAKIAVESRAQAMNSSTIHYSTNGQLFNIDNLMMNYVQMKVSHRTDLTSGTTRTGLAVDIQLVSGAWVELTGDAAEGFIIGLGLEIGYETMETLLEGCRDRVRLLAQLKDELADVNSDIEQENN